jgi:hypothetical protein
VRPSAAESVERQMLESQGGLLEPEPVVEGKEELRGTGVGASKEAYPAGEVVEGRDTGKSPPSFRRAAAHRPHRSQRSQLVPSSKSQELSPVSRSAKQRSASASTRATARRRPFSLPTHLSTSLSSFRSALSCPSLLSLAPTLPVWDSPTTTSEPFALYQIAEHSLILTNSRRETEEYELAPAWKRYTFAGGFIGIAGGLIWWGSVAPGRYVKLSLSST